MNIKKNRDTTNLDLPPRVLYGSFDESSAKSFADGDEDMVPPRPRRPMAGPGPNEPAASARGTGDRPRPRPDGSAMDRPPLEVRRGTAPIPIEGEASYADGDVNYAQIKPKMAAAESCADGDVNYAQIKPGMAAAESYADGDVNHIQPEPGMAEAESSRGGNGSDAQPTPVGARIARPDSAAVIESTEDKPEPKRTGPVRTAEEERGRAMHAPADFEDAFADIEDKPKTRKKHSRRESCEEDALLPADDEFAAAFDDDEDDFSEPKTPGKAKKIIMIAACAVLGVAILAGAYLLYDRYLKPDDPAQVLAAQVEEHKLAYTSYMSISNFEAAVVAMNAAISLDPEDANLYLYRAQAYISREDFEAAVADCETALSLSPERKDLYTSIAQLYTLLEDDNKAIAAYTQAIASDGENAELYLYRCRLYIQIGDLTAAEADCTKLTALDSSKAAIYESLATAYLSQEDQDGAIRAYTAAYTLTGEIRYLSARLDRYLALDDTEGAFADAEALIEAGEPSLDLYKTAAACAEALGDTETAVARYLEAAALESGAQELAELQLSIARGYMALEDYTNALDYFTRYLDTRPWDSTVYVAVGECYYYGNNDASTAQTWFKKCLDAGVQLGAANYAMGRIQMDQEAYKKAYEYFTVSIEQEYNLEYSYYYRGVSYMNASGSGRYNDKAKEDFNSVLEISENESLRAEAQACLDELQ